MPRATVSVPCIRKLIFVLNLSVAENLFIGREPRKFGFIDWHTMNKKATELLKSLDIDARATDKLEECSLAKQQMIAIARAVDMKCQVLILDEPTSSLDDEEVEKLFVLMRRLQKECSWYYLCYASLSRYMRSVTGLLFFEMVHWLESIL